MLSLVEGEVVTPLREALGGHGAHTCIVHGGRATDPAAAAGTATLAGRTTGFTHRFTGRTTGHFY